MGAVEDRAAHVGAVKGLMEPVLWLSRSLMERQSVQRAREAFLSGRARPLEFRLQQLHALQRMITEKEAEIATALKQDINRVGGVRMGGNTAKRPFLILIAHLFGFIPQSQYDTPLLELIGIENEVKLAIKKLAQWAAPRPVEKNLLTISDEVYIQPEPLGVVLIIGAWNYPWALTLLPLIGAIAAGRRSFRILLLFRGQEANLC